MNNRIASLDIAKGLAIVAVVQGHIHNYISFNKFIFLIHICFFFCISGLFINEGKYNSIKDFLLFVIKRFKRLCIPYIILNTVFTLLHNFFIKINLYTNNNNFFVNNNHVDWSFSLQEVYTTKVLLIKTFWALIMARTETLILATWFLPVLFFSSCIVVAIIILSKKLKSNNNIFKLLGIFCVVEAGYYCAIHNIDVYGIGRILSCVLPIFIGVLFHKHLDSLREFGIKELSLSLAVLLILNTVLKNVIRLNNNDYYDPLLLAILTILSLLFFISLSNLIEKYKFSSFLSYIGRHTLSILCLHSISFKLITLLQIVIYKDPIIRLASFQTYNTTGLWGIAYLIIGVLVPILLNELCKVLKKGLIK